MIIVDALSEEQLSGNVRQGRSRGLSVVYVQVDGTKGEGIYAKTGWDMNVMAKRMDIGDARDAVRECKAIPFAVPHSHDMHFGGPGAYYGGGILLYDPARPVYDKTISSPSDPDDIASATRQALALDPPLPPEIVTKIIALAEEESDLKLMTSAPPVLTLNTKRLDIHLLVPLDPQEIFTLQA